MKTLGYLLLMAFGALFWGYLKAIWREGMDD